MRAALLLLSGLALAACPAATPSEAPRAGEATAPAWVAVEVAPGDGATEAPARVLPGPGAAAVVAPPLRATVVRVRVRPGDAVDAGAPLLDVLMPEVLEAAGRLEGARARLGAWTERHQQLRALKSEGLARTLDVSEAAARVAEAKAETQAARATLLAAGLREADAAGLLAGALGESREPTQGPLLRLSGPGAVRVEARLTRPAVGEGWRFVTPAGATPLRLVGATPTADARDGAWLAWFEPEAGAPLAAGTQGRVVQAGAEARALLVPAIAVRRRDGAALVVTRRGEVAIDVERCDVGTCVVTGALSPGDEVRAERPR